MHVLLFIWIEGVILYAYQALWVTGTLYDRTGRYTHLVALFHHSGYYTRA
jgi:hypothetical protein